MIRIFDGRPAWYSQSLPQIQLVPESPTKFWKPEVSRKKYCLKRVEITFAIDGETKLHESAMGAILEFVSVHDVYENAVRVLEYRLNVQNGVVLVELYQAE